MNACAFNPKAVVELRHIGKERHPLLIIEDLAADPEALAALAADAAWSPAAETYYPGLNAPLPRAYLEEISTRLRPTLARAFGLNGEADLICSGFFALATWELAQFGPWQRIPHYDHPTPGALAMVHYLSHGPYGGTAFFAHDETGFEAVDAARREAYLAKTTAWLDANGAALDGFAGPQTPGYRMHAKVDFRFNRAVIYPSYVLHCALFGDAPLRADPRSGRLTVNSFLQGA